MNVIETLRERLQQRFPEGTFTVTAPLRAEDVWTLDIALGGRHHVVEWDPSGRAGVSEVSETTAFGGGPDAFFLDIDEAWKDLEARLR